MRSVFQRTYRDTKGKNRETKNWYIEFAAGNRTMREATDFTNRTDAAEWHANRLQITRWEKDRKASAFGDEQRESLTADA